MNLKYDYYGRTEPSKIYLSKVGKRIICLLNGVDESSCSLTLNFNNSHEISFDVYRYVDGMETAGYELLDAYMELYVSNIGWFKMNPPTISNDGINEKKSITAESLEIELQNYDLVDMTFNYGSTYSQEMLVENNIIETDGVKLPKNQILFWRDTSGIETLLSADDVEAALIKYVKQTNIDSLSQTNLLEIKINSKFYSGLLELIMRFQQSRQKVPSDIMVAKSKYENNILTHDEAKSIVITYPYILTYTDLGIVSGSTAKDVVNSLIAYQKNLSLLDIILEDASWWKVGHVDATLKNKVERFEISSQDIYSFLCQDVASAYECIFIFDSNTYTVNAYDPELYGEDTNVYIGFRNVQNEVTTSIDDQDLYTAINVRGNDDLNIGHVNFGDYYLYNIDYYLTTQYLPQNVIDTYVEYCEYRESCRDRWIELSKRHIELENIMSDIKERNVLDGCNEDWSEMGDEQLLQAKSEYEAQIVGYEAYYVDENGDFDLEALKNSSDWNDYVQIKETILPNIKIAIENRDVIDKDDEKDYLDAFETTWSFFGLEELEYKISVYKNSILLAEKAGHNKPPSDMGIESTAKTNYQTYLKNVQLLKECQEYHDKLQEEYDAYKKEQDAVDYQRKQLKKSVDLSLFLDEDDYNLIRRLFRYSDYVNENILITDYSTTDEIITQQKELMKNALEELSRLSQPQFVYTTSLDNFLALAEYKEFQKQLNLGDFIRLGVRDDYAVKLRVISLSYNPLIYDEKLDVGFSNMVQYSSKRNDLASIIDRSIKSSKNQISSNYNSSSNQEGMLTLTTGLLQKIVSNKSFNNYINNAIASGSGNSGGGGDVIIDSAVIGSLLADYIKVTELEAEIAKIDHLEANSAFIKYLEANLIIAENADFKNLKADIANIENAIIGASSTVTGLVMHLNADNAVIDSALIKTLVSQHVSIGDLAAGSIDTNKFTISSGNGNQGLLISGATQQFIDKNNTVRIQIGEDANGDYNFVIRGENGATLIDDTGITENAIVDGMLKDEMFKDADGDYNGISGSKINVNSVVNKINADGSSKFSSTLIYFDDEEKTLHEKFQEINYKVEHVGGAESYRIEIDSTQGNIFTNNVISTDLVCTLYLNGFDVTSNYKDSCFIWTRTSASAELDEYWNSQHQAGTKRLHITNEDIYKKAKFSCAFIVDETVIAQSSV